VAEEGTEGNNAAAGKDNDRSLHRVKSTDQHGDAADND
jgi:hypothetical protein